MRKNLSIFVFILLALPILVFAQNKREVMKKAPIMLEEPTTVSRIPTFNLGTGVMPSSPTATWIEVDTMSNAFGPAIGALNPVAYDASANVAAVVHRGKTPYAVGSGELWYNISTDKGVTWTRVPAGINTSNPGRNGRYPSMAISNPTGGDLSATTGLFAWPELNPGAFGWVGYGADQPVGAGVTFAGIEQGANTYSSQVPCWASDNSPWLFWSSDNSVDAAVDVWRTQDFSTIEKFTIPSSVFEDGGNITMGGASHNGVLYYGALGTYPDPTSPIVSGWYPGYLKSTDNGATWTPKVCDFRAIPSLARFDRLFDYKKGDTFVSYDADMNVDKNGYVHIVCSLTDTTIDNNTGSNAVVELIETASGWDGKIVFEGLEPNAYLGGPGLGQMGPSPYIAFNKDRDVIAVQWTNSTATSTFADIFQAYRSLTGEFSAPVNLTQSDNINNTQHHLAPTLAQTGSNYTAFSMYGYVTGATGPYTDTTLATTIYMAAVPFTVSAAPTVDVTFNVDMGVQAYKGLFNPATDAVKIAGNFNGWNNGADVMTDANLDTIYTITKSFNVGDTLSFKFIKGTDGWENDPNRQYVVPSVNSTYAAWFNNDSSYQILTPINMTFACNMEFEIVSGRFNPATDTLSARGSFNGWSSDWKMTPSTGDPNVYEVTKTVNTFAGETFNYKYAYITGLGTNWENDPNKTYTVTGSDITGGFAYTLRTFNNLTLDNVTNFPCTIKFTVNMAGAISSINLQPLAPVTDVRLCGANPPLRWPAGGWPNADSALTIRCYDNGTNGDLVAGDNIWSRDVTFPKYSPLNIQYKYGANWGLPTNQGGNDNENGVSQDHFINLLPAMMSATVQNVFGTMGTHTLVNVVLDVASELPGIPVVYDLAQNFPNPFNPSTSVQFSIPEAGMVSIKVFNLLGEEVATLLNEFKNAGNYNVNFNAANLTSGVYIYKINAGNFSMSKKMMLMK